MKRLVADRSDGRYACDIRRIGATARFATVRLSIGLVMRGTRHFLLLAAVAAGGLLVGIYVASIYCKKTGEKIIAAYIYARSIPWEAKELHFLEQVVRNMDTQTPAESRSRICGFIDIKVRGLREQTDRFKGVLPAEAESAFNVERIVAVAEEDATYCAAVTPGMAPGR